MSMNPNREDLERHRARRERYEMLIARLDRAESRYREARLSGVPPPELAEIRSRLNLWRKLVTHLGFSLVRDGGSKRIS